MLLLLLYLCLVIQIGLAIKLFLNAPRRRLNIYLSLVPTLFVVSTILEINFIYLTDKESANLLYKYYQCFAFFPIVFLTLAIYEYLKNYSERYNDRVAKGLCAAMISVNALWIFLLLFKGPSARIFLASPGKWSIDSSTISLLFLCHTYSSLFWLTIIFGGFLFLGFKAETQRRRLWFRMIACFQFIIVIGVGYFIYSHRSGNTPQYDLTAAIPSTASMIMQLWILSGLSLFDIHPRNLYADVMIASSDWFIVLEDSGKIKFINKTALKKSGHSQNELINSNSNSLIEIRNADGAVPSISTFLKQLTRANFEEITLTFKKSKLTYSLQSSAKRITLPDGSEAFLWVLIDNTKIDTLTIQKKIIEQKSVELSKVYSDTLLMMNMTSHDLKTPLKTIAELAGLVSEEIGTPLPNKASELLGYIKSISEQSLILSNQMIEFMRIKVIEKKREKVVMSDLLEEIQNRFFLDLKQAMAEIRFRGVREIYSDRHQLRELLANLIENSIKYRTEAPPIIEISITEDDEKYFFTVRDNGIGVLQDFVPQAFSGYTREEKVISHGSGIGLFICKSIIESNKGEIKLFRNAPHAGITIVFTLAKD